METQDKKEPTYNQEEMLQAMTSGSISAARRTLEAMDNYKEEEYEEWKKQEAEARERFHTIHNPNYLIEKGEVPDTVVTRTLALFIKFCHYIPHDKFLCSGKYDDCNECVLDDGKLSFILLHMFGVDLDDVYLYFSQHKVADMMRYVEEHTSKLYRENLEAFEKWTQETREDILELFLLHNEYKPFRLECNLACTNIIHSEVCYSIYHHYHIVISVLERQHLHTFEDMATYVLYRLWNGGQFHPLAEDKSWIMDHQTPLEKLSSLRKKSDEEE